MSFENFQDTLDDFFDMQVDLNNTILPGWENQELNWCRAIRHEAAECVDHIGWKWWKSTELDADQAKMEIIDIFHFWLSLMHDRNWRGSSRKVVDVYRMQSTIDVFSMFKNPGLLIDYVEDFSHQVFCWEKYGDIYELPRAFEMYSLLCAYEIPFEKLTRLFVAKNTLNIFRTKNGYKEGAYVKVWDGREDNEWLQSIIDSKAFDWSEPLACRDKLYGHLEHTYEHVNNLTAVR